MVVNYARLLRPTETVEYSARVTLLGPDSQAECIALVVSHDLEGALILVHDGTIPETRGAMPLYMDVLTKTTQLDTLGYSCEITTGSNTPFGMVAISVTEVTVLQELLFNMKHFIAQADDHSLRSTGRSHQWVTAYLPWIDTTDNTRSPSADSSQINSHTPDSVVSTSTTPTVSANPFLTSEVTPYSNERENQLHHHRLKDYHVKKTLNERRDEYTESRTIQLKCSTWNMAGKDIVESLSTLLKSHTEDEITIYCTAFQEMDLSAEAYLTNTDLKAQRYHEYIQRAIGEYYELIASHQLVGMLLCIYAHKSVAPTISNVIKSYVPCGILGMVGNKGGVGVKFDVMDTSFAVINCHLAAGQGGAEKRNSDFQDISKRIFNDSGVWHSGLDGIDNVIVLGDLNYRIASTRAHVDDLIAKKDLLGLLDYDQLSEEKKTGHTFAGWQEGDITFDPTYKYDVGTCCYDSSEKQRIPSWTDRILIRSAHGRMHLIKDTYTSIPEYLSTDHKPVIAVFEAQVEVMLKDRHEAVRGEVLKQFDRYEDEAKPNIRLREGEDDIDFGEVYHMQPVSRAFTVYNSGSSVSKFSFSRNHTSGTICKHWFWPVPCFGSLLPKHSAKIRITAFVDHADARLLNSGAQVFNDVLVLHVDGGADKYVSLGGRWQPTCIGQSLEFLSSAHGVRSQQQHAESSDLVTFVPQEIHRICEHLLTQPTQGHLFLGKATKYALDKLQENLDANASFEEISDTTDMTNALCILLIDILQWLTTPIVLDSLYDRVMAAAPIEDILDALPSINLNVLIYLQGFLSSAIPAHSSDAKLQDRLCRVFGDVLLRQHNVATEQEVTQKRLFMRRLISSS